MALALPDAATAADMTLADLGVHALYDDDDLAQRHEVRRDIHASSSRAPPLARLAGIRTRAYI